MDYFLFRSVARALGEVLPGARVRRVFQTTPLGVGLELDRGILYFALDPGRAGVYWLKEPILAGEGNHFARYLESLLKGALVRGVSQVPGERILRLELVKRDLVGHGETYTLVAEIMGRHSNLMVLDGEGKILEAAKRIYRDMSRVREVLPGRDYTPPPPHSRLDPFSMDREEFLELLTREASPLEALAKRTLFSPYALKEMEHRLGTPQEGPRALLRIWEIWQEMRGEMDEGKGYLYRRDERVLGVYPLPLYHLGRGEEGPLLSRVEAFARERWQGEAWEALRARLLKAVRKELKKVRRILSILAEEEKDARTAEKYKRWGDILLIHLSRIPQGVEEVELEDPYIPGQIVRIPIPRRRSPSRAAQEYFQRYSKLKRKAQAVATRKEEMKAQKDHLEELEWLLESARDLEELKIMERELEAEGLVKERKGRKRPGEPVVLPYRVFRSTLGSTILVGRHPRGNEEVTFHQAGRRDLWFHVRGYPGAHVVLRNPRPDPREVQEAAALAAYFSKARQAPAVDVDYTQRRHVRKIPGSAPGLVTYRDFSTIRVEPQIPQGVVEEG